MHYKPLSFSVSKCFPIAASFATVVLSSTSVASLSFKYERRDSTPSAMRTMACVSLTSTGWPMKVVLLKASFSSALASGTAPLTSALTHRNKSRSSDMDRHSPPSPPDLETRILTIDRSTHQASKNCSALTMSVTFLAHSAIAADRSSSDLPLAARASMPANPASQRNARPMLLASARLSIGFHPSRQGLSSLSVTKAPSPSCP
mmetsp:Transcript_19581/g.56378  ORF Transcript_19581/g.56378 Transcript_19581/m.56378 type:complete len:204 (-) Transcript_19581:62-673(-)